MIRPPNRPEPGESIAFGALVLAAAFLEAEGVPAFWLWMLATVWVGLRFL